MKFTEVDTKFNKDEMVQLQENPFCPGGDVSEDGELIIQLWRDGKLNEYYRNCEQERVRYLNITHKQKHDHLSKERIWLHGFSMD